MSALIQDGSRSYRRIDFELVPLAAGIKAIKAGLAMLITSGPDVGYYAPASSGKTGVVKGTFAETVDNTTGVAGAVSANMEYGEELYVELVANDTGSPVVATDRGKICYALDDQTATMAVGTCGLGRVHGLSDDGLVEVEILSAGEEEGEAAGISAVAPVDPSSTAAAAGVAVLAAAQDHKHHIALATPAAEGLMSGAYAGAISPSAATTTAIKAIAAAARANGMLVVCQADGSKWRFHATSTASDATENLVLTPGVGGGRWLRADATIALSIAVTKDNTDNQTIFTTPAGARLKVRESWWDVTTSWTGGSSSAIGLHASPTGWTTKGDILGGAAGDVLATLVSTSTGMVGTIGTKLDTYADGRLLLEPGDTLKFDRIASAFTAGAANARVLVDVVANAGA